MNEMFEPVIGLEVHAQLATNSKAFCGCPTLFGNEPNTNVCPICLGMPGTLPVLNKRVVEFVVRMGLATNCSISPQSILARKNYFYPDLPKGYQISQYEEPICTNGFIDVVVEGNPKRIGITRIHMEEDAGKSIHDVGSETLVDLNRSGVPLIEIVTEPDIRSPREAYLYVSQMRQLVTYLGICDGNMEEGSLRCDANVSVRRKGEVTFGIKTEVKNMNSMRNVERALQFEIDRQIMLLEEGKPVVQETLLWDANQNVTFSMRGKEEAHDYRYFPEPDLVPVFVDEQWREEIRSALPEFPAKRCDRFVSRLGLPLYDAEVLTAGKDIADYYERTLGLLSRENRKSEKENAKIVSNWVMTDVLRIIGVEKIEIAEFAIQPARLASLIELILNGTISGKIARDVFEEMRSIHDEPSSIILAKGWTQVSDRSAIEPAVDDVLAANKVQVEKYLSGNEKIFGFFVGETMKKLKGKANPGMVNEVLNQRLSAESQRRDSRNHQDD